MGRVAARSTRYDPLIDLLRASVRPHQGPPAFEAYLDKVRRNAFTITEEDVRALKEAGHSEDEIFERTVGAAVAAGLERLDAGLRTLR
jgi:hypothetical protein